MGNFVKNRRVQSGSTGAVLPGGDSAVRPEFPDAGLIRFNSDSAALEFFDGTQFVTLSSGATYGNANVAAYLPTYTGNLSPGNILTDNYLYANGQPVDFQQAAGSDTYVQYNQSGDFGANANFTFDSANVLLQVGPNSQGAIETGNLQANVANLISINVITDANVGNLGSSGTVDATGNITTLANAVIGSITIFGSGNVVLNNTNINNLADPVANSDAATRFYVDSTVSANVADLGNLVFANTTITTDGTLANITITPTAAANGLVVIDAVTGLILPTGNTAQRPGNASAGTIRFNSSTEVTEVYTGTDWISVGNTFGVITTQVINGNSVANVFTLDQTATANSIIVVNNGVVQQPDVAYTVTGNTITFAEPPAVADTVTVRFVSPVITVNEITNDSGANAIAVDESGVGNLATTQSLQLPSYTVAQANALANTAPGQIIYVTNGDSGNACLAVYSSGSWKRVALGATIST